jgi:CRP-like cAMP-binding protein
LKHSLRLLVVDPDLASAINDAAHRRSALQGVTAGRLDLVQGEQFQPASVDSSAELGVIVLSGFLVRELTTAAGRVAADLIGPEDVLQLDGTASEVSMLHHSVSWTAITDVRLALLDEDFFVRASRWPEISRVLVERSSRVGQRLAVQGAVATLQSVDARLLASFWTWASKWATVARQGVMLRVPLSHERLARLINARRPTVTTALGRLRRGGLVVQGRDGSWLLHGPRSESGVSDGLDGVEMPVLAEMTARGLGVRRTEASMSTADTRALARRELKARLAEQRTALQAATKRHNEMLERLRRETERLLSTEPGRRDSTRPTR